MAEEPPGGRQLSTSLAGVDPDGHGGGGRCGLSPGGCAGRRNAGEDSDDGDRRRPAENHIVESFVDVQIFRWDSAEDLLGAGLASGHFEHGRLLELNEPVFDGGLPQGAGGLALGDQPPQLAIDP